MKGELENSLHFCPLRIACRFFKKENLGKSQEFRGLVIVLIINVLYSFGAILCAKNPAFRYLLVRNYYSFTVQSVTFSTAKGYLRQSVRLPFAPCKVIFYGVKLDFPLKEACFSTL